MLSICFYIHLYSSIGDPLPLRYYSNLHFSPKCTKHQTYHNHSKIKVFKFVSYKMILHEWYGMEWSKLYEIIMLLFLIHCTAKRNSLLIYGPQFFHRFFFFNIFFYMSEPLNEPSYMLRVL